MKILLIEDEQTLFKVLKEKFERSGYDVEIATDGESAITIAKKSTPDIIILDLMLPKKNGFEVLEVFKSDDTLKNVPVIVVSNLGEDNDIKRALSLGAADYYVKTQHPINEIVEKIKNLLIQSK